MTFSEFINKIKKRLWYIIVVKTRNSWFYPKIYKSYLHSLVHMPNEKVAKVNYFSAIPNRGAGIGHQLANWIAGYWFAKQFGLRFAHIPFSTISWDLFLGFGEDEISVDKLISKNGYKKVRLPLFDEFNPDEVALIKKIILSYNDKRVVFVVEQDQFYRDQYEVMSDLKRKFYHAKARELDQLIYKEDSFNIAIHVRRGDINILQGTHNKNILMRWQNSDYFEKILSTVIENMKTEKSVNIYLFSQGSRQDFQNFEKFENIHFCLDLNAQDSFLHMVYADLLITSKSSFSYKSALLSNGIKICPINFWHGYPNSTDWILAKENGTFNVNQLSSK